MRAAGRRGVSPVIATLLLIAIAVAAAIIVYVYVTSLAGGLTTGGGQQVSDQVALDAYNYGTIATGALITIRDVGSGSVTISAIFYDGTLVPGANLVSQNPATCAVGTVSVGPSTTCQFTINTAAATGATSGTAHLVKVLTVTGGTSVITVIAGRSG